MFSCCKVTCKNAKKVICCAIATLPNASFLSLAFLCIIFRKVKTCSFKSVSCTNPNRGSKQLSGNQQGAAQEYIDKDYRMPKLLQKRFKTYLHSTYLHITLLIYIFPAKICTSSW